MNESNSSVQNRTLDRIKSHRVWASTRCICLRSLWLVPPLVRGQATLLTLPNRMRTRTVLVFLAGSRGRLGALLLVRPLQLRALGGLLREKGVFRIRLLLLVLMRLIWRRVRLNLLRTFSLYRRARTRRRMSLVSGFVDSVVLRDGTRMGSALRSGVLVLRDLGRFAIGVGRR